MLHFYLTDTPQVKKGDRALCGHVSDGEQSEGDKKCPICVALKRAEGLKEGKQ